MTTGKLTATLLEAAQRKKLPGSAKEKPASREERRTGKKGPGLYACLAGVYARMEAAYDACAREAGLRCDACEQNCCTSFFQHHTYVEWAYLWRGLHTLSAQRRKTFLQRAQAYVNEARQSLALNRIPSAMCPLNENGLCSLYPYRLMICRLHGTRNVFTLPDGRQQIFPGCARFSALPCAQGAESAPGSSSATGAPGLAPPEAAESVLASPSCPTLDRTPFYQELAALELEFLAKASAPLPRVNLTLAEMIVLGPPKIR